MAALNFTTNATQLIVGGGTFHVKEMLKLHGAKWNPEARAWALSIELDSPTLRSELETAVLECVAAHKASEKERRAYWNSPAGKAETAAANLASALSNGWACCKKARVVDFGRKHCSCMTHGFHKGGILYTGD